MTSDKFVKYTSIENHYQEGFLARCPQEDIWWCMTEKIHGANFQVYYDGENFLIGSRNRFIGNENFNNIQALVEAIRPNIELLKKRTTLPITLYGEVYGDGIQKGVKYSKTKRIRFFDLKIGTQYVPYFLAEYWMNMHGLPNVPVINTFYGNVSDAVMKADTRFNSIIADLDNDGYVGLEENIVEGVVIKPYFDEFKSDRGARVIIKKKNEEFWEKSHTPKAKVKDDRFVDYKADEDAVMVYINQNRFDSVFSKDQYIKTNFGDFIKAYTEDVVEDAAKDNVEFKNIKNIHNIIARTTKIEYFNRVAA